MTAKTKILEWPAAAVPMTGAGSGVLTDGNVLALWTSDEIAAATGGTASGAFQVSGVEMDSRDVRFGDLFFALKGEAMDGHRFLDKAFAAGATAAVVDRVVDYPHVLVADTNKALEDLAKAARLRSAAQIIGVTGSVGKTGVKEAIFTALERGGRGSSHRSVRSYNNHVGVPLSLARMASRARFGVFEMGMNHAGEIAALTAQVRPHVAVVTTIAPAHIENLGSEAAIADAKAEIFAGLETGGIAVIPADSPHWERMRDEALAHNAKVVSFGIAAHADVRLLEALPTGNGGSIVTAAIGDKRICYTVAEPGGHWITNSLCVMAVVDAVGGDLGAAGLALAEMGGLKGRGARFRRSVAGGQVLFIDESYNANPASMRATLAQLGATPATRRIAVLGSMKELGDFGPSFHAQLTAPLEDAKVDFAVLVGEEMAALAEELGKFSSTSLGKSLPFAHCAVPQEAITSLEGYGLQGGDAVLVKGSNSVGLGKLIAHFAAKEG